MDFHSDGKVNYSEFLAATISSINFTKEEKLWSAFKYFDTTDSGYITLDSVIEALKETGVFIDEEGLHKTFVELKKKGKKINFTEFKAIAFGGKEEEIKEEYRKKEEDEDNENNNNNKVLNTENDNNDEGLEKLEQPKEIGDFYQDDNTMNYHTVA